MCLYPTLIKNRRYTKTKKNGGQVPPIIDLRTEYVPIGCNVCIECRKQVQRAWQVRLMEDVKEHKNGKFVAFTFSDAAIAAMMMETVKQVDKETGKIHNKVIGEMTGYERDNAIATRAMRLFLERWRKEHKVSLRHWAVTELGHKGTENIHIHAIVWTDTPEKLERIWQYGTVWRGYKKNGNMLNYVTERTVNYIVKYLSKQDAKHTQYKPKILTSSGIGSSYTKRQAFRENEYKGENTNETYRTGTGHKIALPIYYRNKAYSEIERERLWVQRLDKQERWVCGEKVDVSKGDKEYIALRQWYRERNIKLGYGVKNEKDNDKKKYEERTRDIMIQTRLKRIGKVQAWKEYKKNKNKAKQIQA